MGQGFQIGDRVARMDCPEVQYAVIGLLVGSGGQCRYGLVPWIDGEDDGPEFPTFPITTLGWADPAELVAVK